VSAATLRSLIATGLLVLGAMSLPAPASAQVYPCPAGPRPGDVQVAETHDRLPLCGPMAQLPPSRPKPIRVPDVHAGIAFHPDVDGAWIEGNRTNGKQAERAALEACRKAAGNACYSGGSWRNSSMSLLKNREGQLLLAWLGDGGKTRDKVMADCKARQVLDCEWGATIPSSLRTLGSDASKRKRYLAAAWVVGQGYDDRLYITTGAPSADAAIKGALDACRNATARECKVQSFTGNGVLQTFKLGGAEQSATPERTPERAAEAAQVLCQRQRKACTLQAVYNARSAGQFVHDFTAARR
jgi:hypothetical protein